MRYIEFANINRSNKITNEKKSKDDPCWKGYRQLGTKKKNGKTVPNCVKEKLLRISNNSLS